MIYLYSLPSCSKCQVLKHQLLKENIQFKIIDDIEEIQDAMIYAKTMSIPFVSINGEYIVEPSIKKIKEEL